MDLGRLLRAAEPLGGIRVSEVAASRRGSSPPPKPRRRREGARRPSTSPTTFRLAASMSATATNWWVESRTSHQELTSSGTARPCEHRARRLESEGSRAHVGGHRDLALSRRALPPERLPRPGANTASPMPRTKVTIGDRCAASRTGWRLSPRRHICAGPNRADAAHRERDVVAGEGADLSADLRSDHRMRSSVESSSCRWPSSRNLLITATGIPRAGERRLPEGRRAPLPAVQATYRTRGTHRQRRSSSARRIRGYPA